MHNFLCHPLITNAYQNTTNNLDIGYPVIKFEFYLVTMFMPSPAQVLVWNVITLV